MWQPQIEALQSEFHILTPDLPGFGGNPPRPASIEEMADEVAGLIREPVVLGGLSMGGYVALAFARNYPAKLRGLILADTKAEADDAAGKANRDKMIAFAESHSAREVIDSMMSKMAVTPAGIERVRALASQQSSAGIVNEIGRAHV